MGGRSTNLESSSTARMCNRSAALSRFAGTRGATTTGGAARRRVAVERGSPVNAAAARVVTPAVVSSA